MKEILRLVSNLFGGTEVHIKVLLDRNITHILIKGLVSDQFDLQREAVRGIENACCDDEFVKRITDINVLILLMKLMRVPDTAMAISSMKIIRTVLVHFTDMIEVCAKNGLFDILDELHYASTEGKDVGVGAAAASLSDELSELFEDTDLISYEPQSAQTSSFSFNAQSGNMGVFTFGADSNNDNSRGGGGRGRGMHLLRPAWMNE
jgi:hypothetical protein